MSTKKLTRATIPMCWCRRCGGQVRGVVPDYACGCGACYGETYEHQPDWGYHAPGVETIREVVREMLELGNHPDNASVRVLEVRAILASIRRWSDALSAALGGNDYD